MRLHTLLLVLLTIAPAAAWNQESSPNVNSRYVVESIDLPSQIDDKLPDALRAEVQKLVGARLDQQKVDALSDRIRAEIATYQLTQRVVKGSTPDSVRIVYDALVTNAAWESSNTTNVNSRYTVEAAEVSSRYESKISDSLRSEIKKLAGAKFDQEQVDRLSRRIRKELGGYRVVQRIAKGTRPDSIRITFEVARSRREQDLTLPRLVYNSKENFTFGLDATMEHEGNQLTFGILTDNNELIERYSGIRGGFHRVLLDGHIRAGVMAETWRSQWNGAVLSALAAQSPSSQEIVPGIYRKRQQILPTVEFNFSGLTLMVGVSVQRLQTQFPAARYESSNALVTSLRLHQQLEIPGLGTHNVDAGYSLRAATQSLGSDFTYTRHAFNARYQFARGEEAIAAEFTGGYLTGTAPLLDRFLLGNSTTLRGYNKYDVAPLGGSRMAHGSVDYRHHWFRAVYDVGSIYNRGANAKVYHSLAAGLVTGTKRDELSFLVAFPLRSGRVEPIFILGMNF